MLSEFRGANSVSVVRVYCEWGKFRELSGILRRRENVSLKLKEKVYVTCVRSALVYGIEIWAVNEEQIG